METKTGVFLVSQADDNAATLTDVKDRQVHALSAQADPPLEQGEVLSGTLESDGEIDVAWQISAIEDRRTISIEESPEPPTKQEQTLSDDQSVGDVTRRERAGEGEIHVITVPEETTEQAVEDIRDDPETLARAARLGIDRVEIRAENGVVSVRYLPN